MKQMIISILTVLTLMGCSKIESPDTGGATVTNGEIQVTAHIEDARTRALATSGTGLTGVSFVVMHGASTPAYWTDGAVHTGNVAATTGKVTFATAPLYTSSDKNAWMVAYYPGGGTIVANTIDWDIDGKTDIMVTKTVWDAGKYTAPVTTGLTFDHILARIEVVLKAEAAAGLDVVRKAWGDIRTIEFMNAPSIMRYQFSTSPVVNPYAPKNFALLANYNGGAFAPMAIPASNNSTANAMAMLATVAATTTESFMLKVTAAGDGTTPIEVEIPVNLNGNLTALKEGYVHRVTLTFKANDKKIEAETSTVSGWTDGTDGKNEVPAPKPIS